MAGKQTGERRALELRTLVGVEDFRPAVTSESILQRLDAEPRLQINCYDRFSARLIRLIDK